MPKTRKEYGHNQYALLLKTAETVTLKINPGH